MRTKRQVSSARSLRIRQTDAENTLWRHLRNRSLDSRRFRRQVPLGPYVVDSVCFEAKLIVEADGGQQASNKYDIERDAYFEASGYRVLRVWNTDILQNTEGVLSIIKQAISGSDIDH